MQSLGVKLDEPRLRRSIGSRVRRVHQEGKVAGERPSNAMPKAAKATLAARISWTLPCEPGEEPGVDFDRRGRVVVGTVVRRIFRNDEPSSPRVEAKPPLAVPEPRRAVRCADQPHRPGFGLRNGNDEIGKLDDIALWQDPPNAGERGSGRRI